MSMALVSLWNTAEEENPISVPSFAYTSVTSVRSPNWVLMRRIYNHDTLLMRGRRKSCTSGPKLLLETRSSAAIRQTPNGWVKTCQQRGVDRPMLSVFRRFKVVCFGLCRTLTVTRVTQTEQGHKYLSRRWMFRVAPSLLVNGVLYRLIGGSLTTDPQIPSWSLDKNVVDGQGRKRFELKNEFCLWATTRYVHQQQTLWQSHRYNVCLKIWPVRDADFHLRISQTHQVPSCPDLPHTRT